MSSTSETPAAADEAVQPPKPPFLRRVRIRNYKSIAFCDLTLEPLTILVGRNASGKSNFVDALGFLRDVVRFGVGEAVERHGGPDAILHKPGDSRTVSIEVGGEYHNSSDNHNWDYVYELEAEFREQAAPVIVREAVRLARDNQSIACDRTGMHLDLSGGFPDRSIEVPSFMADRSILPFYFPSMMALAHLLDSMLTYSFLSPVLRLLRKPTPGRVLEPDGANLSSVLETSRGFDPWSVERIGQFLRAIVPTVELIGPVRHGDFEIVRFRTHEESKPVAEFDASAMSDGTLRALAALTACYQSIPPHGHPTFVAIEEPETALHPAAMRALVGALDEATLRTQVLVTTHSPDLLDAEEITPTNVRVVQMIDGKTVIGPVDEVGIEIVAEHLNTLAGLEREDRLRADPDDLARQTAEAAGDGAAP